MTKSELIEILARKRNDIPYRDIEQAVKTLLEQMSESLANGERIEIRGFGSFSLHFRPPRVGRNPKTGDAVSLTGKYVPHFKPGKELRERVNERYDATDGELGWKFFLKPPGCRAPFKNPRYSGFFVARP